MSSFLHINRDYSIKVSSRIFDYLNTECICIKYNSSDRLLVKEKDYIYKNQLVMESINDKKFSSISGICLGIKNINKQEFLVIKNDFKEKKEKKFGIKTDISKLSKEKARSLLNKYGSNRVFELVNRLLLDEQIDYLIINGADNEPYIVSNVFLINNYLDDLLETIDAISEIFNIDELFLIIKNIDKDMVSNVIDHIGTYPKIKLKIIGDIYPFNYPKVVSQTVISNIKDNYLVLDINDINEIGNILKKNSPITEKYITISGNGIVNPKVVNCKLYSPIKALFDDEIKVNKDKDYYYIENGLLSGRNIKIDEYIIDYNTKGILYNTIDNYKEKACIKCGQCINNCPMKLNPITDKYSKDCIMCNVCEYLCPSQIDLINTKDGVDENE